MLNFAQIVDNLLCEDSKSVLGTLSTKVPGLDAKVLDVIYGLLAKEQRYISGESWEPYFEFTPVLDVVMMAASQAVKSGKDPKITSVNLLAKSANDADDFFNKIEPYLKVDKLTTLDKNYNIENPNVIDIYNKALKYRSKNILIQNVYPLLQNKTIVQSILSIFDNRLTGLEKVKIKINLLSKNLKTKDTTLLQSLLKDICFNITAYSSGKKPANADIVNVLQQINMTYKDFVELFTHTTELYKILLSAKYPNFDKPNNPVQAAAYKNSLTKENIWTLANEGLFKFIDAKTKELVTATFQQKDLIYNLQKIEKDNTEPGKEIVNLIKDMSSGIREKEGFSSKVAGASQAAGALASLGGAKLYVGS